MLSSVVAVFGRSERSSSPKLLRPLLNSTALNLWVYYNVDPVFRAGTSDRRILSDSVECTIFRTQYLIISTLAIVNI
ncbi:hypothetical protein NPIL_290041 [Nephila pilipes]|uniref:Uncharacterized protein n=1 Tax=Nephila pilipes TaxID=299642 RepID=A0A8X6N4P8_NEPPI|nr:hypothetical protein NPIL_290041 [Nephila pilipes]